MSCKEQFSVPAIKISSLEYYGVHSFLPPIFAEGYSPCYDEIKPLFNCVQGLGETFGRVTIEAMAFGLPVW